MTKKATHPFIFGNVGKHTTTAFSDIWQNLGPHSLLNTKHCALCQAAEHRSYKTQNHSDFNWQNIYIPEINSTHTINKRETTFRIFM